MKDLIRLYESRQAHDVNITSPQRRCNVMTLHRRWGDVIFTSCARWDEDADLGFPAQLGATGL